MGKALKKKTSCTTRGNGLVIWAAARWIEKNATRITVKDTFENLNKKWNKFRKTVTVVNVLGCLRWHVGVMGQNIIYILQYIRYIFTYIRSIFSHTFFHIFFWSFLPKGGGLHFFSEIRYFPSYFVEHFCSAVTIEILFLLTRLAWNIHRLKSHTWYHTWSYFYPHVFRNIFFLLL